MTGVFATKPRLDFAAALSIARAWRRDTNYRQVSCFCMIGILFPDSDIGCIWDHPPSGAAIARQGVTSKVGFPAS